MKKLKHNETYFKNILENFESNHKLFENGVSVFKNNDVYKPNLLIFAKTRKQRIDESDDFSKMIFKTEKCVWDWFEKRAAKDPNDKHPYKLDQIILGSLDKIYTSTKELLNKFKELFGKINSYEQNKISRELIEADLVDIKDLESSILVALDKFLSPRLDEPIKEASIETSIFLICFVNEYKEGAKSIYPLLDVHDN